VVPEAPLTAFGTGSVDAVAAFAGAGAMFSRAAERSKKTTTEKVGGCLPAQVGVEPEPLAAEAALFAADSDFDSDTRVTPSTERRRDIICATAGWLFAQPAREIAGAAIDPR